MAASTTTCKTLAEFKDLTPAKRRALVAKVAKAKTDGASGLALREQFGSWLTGPVRRSLFREYGHDGLVAGSYDRAAAKAKREAEAESQDVTVA